MNDDMIENAPKYSLRNRSLLTNVCGCYYCLQIYNQNEITKWIDRGQTAICPRCGIDSVLPTNNIKILVGAKEFWLY